MKPLTTQPLTAMKIAARVRASVPAQPWQLVPGLSVTGLAPFWPTRREFLAGAGSLLILAPACGSGEDEAASGETRTIEHALAETEVPASSRRVVVAGGEGHPEHLIALGFEPVAAGDWVLR